jgi:hypothetical protein
MPSKNEKPRKIKVMVLLVTPCVCNQVWAIVKGTPRKRESVKCLTRGHVLTGNNARTRKTYKQIVEKEMRR